MPKSTNEVEPLVAAAGAYRALLAAAGLSTAAVRTAGRRGYRRAVRRARFFNATYGPRTADAFRVLRGYPLPPPPRRRTGLIMTVTLLAGAGAGAGAAITALRVRRSAPIESAEVIEDAVIVAAEEGESLDPRSPAAGDPAPR